MSVVLTFLVNTIFNLIVGLIVAKFLGPAEYGKFALAVAFMAFGQVLAFEWIRLCAIRFYSQRTRDGAPETRATLDAAFLACAALFLPLALALAFFGPPFALPRPLAALAFVAAIANGLFDFQTALVRARFDDRLYVRLIVSKNLLALTLTAGGAWATGSATVALIAGMTSLLGSLGLWRKGLADPGAALRLADKGLIRPFAAYAGPIVTAVVLYQLIPLANRDLAARFFGFAETGKFALAYDLGLRAVQAIGSALDVLLFQIAVRAHDSHGEEKAKAQVAQNMAIVFAILAPACVGLWIVLPSVEALIVPQAFRGPFAHLLGLMLPGLFAYGMTQFAIHPIFQIARKTLPLVMAALVACLADPIFILALPRGDDASSLALAQSLALLVGFFALILFARANAPQWPRFRDLGLTALGCAGMAALDAPLRNLAPGLLLLLAQIALGGGFYAAMVALFDIAGLRSAFLAKLAQIAAREDGKGRFLKFFLPSRLG
jgi:O-antigen/teichoic acid export membrane protein